MIEAVLWLLKMYVKGGITLVTLAVFMADWFIDHPVIKWWQSLAT